MHKQCSKLGLTLKDRFTTIGMQAKECQTMMYF